METRRASIDFCEHMGHHIEQIDSEQFIDEYLVGEQFRIYMKNGCLTDNGTLYIDFYSGVNYYGEIDTSLEIYPDNSFRVERYGESVGPFYSDDLYDGLMDGLADIIER